MALASPGFWPRYERAFLQLDVASWALGVHPQIQVADLGQTGGNRYTPGWGEEG